MTDPKQTYFSRLAWVREQLSEWGVDAVLVTGAANRRWLSGFTGSNGQLLVTPHKALLATDSRYYQQAAHQAPTFDVFKHERTQDDTERFIRAGQANTIGMEAQHVTLAQAAGYRKVEGVTWKTLGRTVEPIRARKTAGELEKIQAAADIADFAMQQVNDLARPRMTEKELAWELEKLMRETGADSAAFTVIVASGVNSALPHYRPGDRELQVGDAIIVDMGAQLDGYNSDLTRSFYLGNEPTERFWQVYNLVLGAQTAVFDNLSAGQTCRNVDAVARDIIEAAGHKEHFGHGVGHGVGLEIHEEPYLTWRAKEDDTLESDMVTTIEPGVYIPDWGGVRIEDLVVVTDDGFHFISHCPKTPVISL